MDMALIKKMLIAYLQEKIKELDAAITAKNYDDIKGIAHKIKGNSGSLAIGLGVFNDIGKLIERGAIDHEPIEKIIENFNQLKSEYEKVASAL